MSLVSFPSWGETLTMDDLVERNDPYYKKFTNVPFTGEISGVQSGSFKKGKKNGEWLVYHENGQLKWEGNHKDGKQDDLWKRYYENGQLEFRSNFKDGKQDGLYEYFYENGQLEIKEYYKDGNVNFSEFFNEDGSRTN